MMKQFALFTLLSAPVFAADKIPQGDLCAAVAARSAMGAMVDSLSVEDLQTAQVELVSVKLKHVIETHPSIPVYEVTVESNIPGWQVYEVETQMRPYMDLPPTCEVKDIRLVGEE